LGCARPLSMDNNLVKVYPKKDPKKEEEPKNV
jgi:hypothetical protein